MNPVNPPGDLESSPTPRRKPWRKIEEHVRRSLLLGATFGIVPFLVLRELWPCRDPDFYWRIGTIDWTLAHGQLPLTDPFSWTAKGTTWIAYSWLSDLLTYVLFRAAGDWGAVLFSILFGLAFVGTLFGHLRRSASSLPLVVLVTCAAAWACAPLFNVRPWLFSMLFSVVTLDRIDVAERTKSARPLLVLLLVYALWANMHIQFLFGLAILGVWAMAPYFEGASEAQPSFRQRVLVLAGCIASLAVGPYHIRIYPQLVRVLGQRPFLFISEFRPLAFRSFHDYLVLAFPLLVAWRLGRMERPRFFHVLLLLMGCFVSLRMSRDLWLIVVVSASIGLRLGAAASRHAPASAPERPFPVPIPQWVGAFAVVFLASLGVVHFRGINAAKLQQETDKTFPTQAIRHIEMEKLDGPLFNDFDFGGYLIWHLRRLPVSMDGRGNVHNNEHIERHVKTIEGHPSWNEDPALATGKTVLLRRERPLTSILRLHPGYILSYEDDVAAVFTKR